MKAEASLIFYLNHFWTKRLRNTKRCLRANVASLIFKLTAVDWSEFCPIEFILRAWQIMLLVKSDVVLQQLINESWASRMEQHSRLLKSKVKQICSNFQANCRTSIFCNLIRHCYIRKVVVIEVQVTIVVVIRISSHYLFYLRNLV